MMPFYLLTRGLDSGDSAPSEDPPLRSGWPNEPPRRSSWRRDPLAVSALIALGFLLGVLVLNRECPTLQEEAGNLERAEVERSK